MVLFGMQVIAGVSYNCFTFYGKNVDRASTKSLVTLSLYNAVNFSFAVSDLFLKYPTITLMSSKLHMDIHSLHIKTPNSNLNLQLTADWGIRHVMNSRSTMTVPFEFNNMQSREMLSVDIFDILGKLPNLRNSARDHNTRNIWITIKLMDCTLTDFIQFKLKQYATHIDYFPLLNIQYSNEHWYNVAPKVIPSDRSISVLVTGQFDTNNEYICDLSEEGTIQPFVSGALHKPRNETSLLCEIKPVVSSSRKYIPGKDINNWNLCYREYELKILKFVQHQQYLITYSGDIKSNVLIVSENIFAEKSQYSNSQSERADSKRWKNWNGVGEEFYGKYVDGNDF